MYALWGRSGVHTVKHAEKQIVVLFVAVGFEIEILRHLGQTLVANQFDIFLHETIVVAPGDAGGACLPDVDMELDELIRIEGARRIQAGEMTYERAVKQRDSPKTLVDYRGFRLRVDFRAASAPPVFHGCLVTRNSRKPPHTRVVRTHRVLRWLVIRLTAHLLLLCAAGLRPP